MDQMDAVGHEQLRAGVLSCIVQHQLHLFAQTNLIGLRKHLQCLLHHGRVHPRQQQPLGLPSGRLDKSRQIQPLVAMMADGDGPHAFR